MEGFLKEHNDILSQRYCETIKESRSEVSEQTIKDNFPELQKSLESLAPSNMIKLEKTTSRKDKLKSYR